MPKAYSYIRMSSKTQERGDSDRRQRERSDAWAAAHGLELDTSYKLRDIGKSGWTGANIDRGDFGKFLDDVRAGKIEIGSFLLVDKLDRLSRQKPRKVLPIFLDLSNAGINIVNVSKDRVFSHDSDDMAFMMDIFEFIMEMNAANKYSDTISDNLGSVWNSKRAKIDDGLKITGKTYWWLKLAENRRDWIILPEVELVRSIFNLSAAGYGAERIVNHLRSKGIEHLDRGKVGKLLRDPAVIGHFQPHKKKRDMPKVKDGKLRENYYPQVIDNDLWLRVQNGLSKRRGKGGSMGRGANISNLFSGLARCGVCGGSIHYFNNDHNRFYLRCYEAVRKGACSNKTSWRYEEFEKAFFRFVEELDLVALTTDGSEIASQRAALVAQIETLEARIADAKNKRDRAFKEWLEDETMDYMKAASKGYDDTAKALETELQALQNMQIESAASVAAFEAAKGELAKFLAGGDMDSRLRLHNHLKGLIEVIQLRTVDKTAMVHFKNGSIRYFGKRTMKLEPVDVETQGNA
jgi:DNA invertase Pin-like site-specific DNA recombinase